jgi:hypothetical protein
MVANHESSRHQSGVRNGYASSGAYDAYNPIIQWMSPSGQSRRFLRVHATSACPLKLTVTADIGSSVQRLRRFPPAVTAARIVGDHTRYVWSGYSASPAISRLMRIAVLTPTPIVAAVV